MTQETSIFEKPVAVPDDLARTAREKAWPGGVLERALQLRMSRADIEMWLNDDDTTPDQIAEFLDRRDAYLHGTVRVREATWADDEQLADLFLHAPEELGDWEVAVERSPNPFAQFRLQKHASVQLVEDRGVILAAAGHSSRNTMVEGKQVCAHIATAWRVRKGFRGAGYSRLLQTMAGVWSSWFGAVNYWYMRSNNVGAFGWLKAVRPDIAEQVEETGGSPPGLPVTVHHIQARPFAGDASGIRGATPEDVGACLELIGRTHDGLDFFDPPDEEWFRQRLDDPMWGPKTPWWPRVYSWDDYFVLEDGGRIVACAGLWDRGANVREAWTNASTGERFVTERTALMDYGYADGQADAMARLIAFLLGRTNDLGRGELMAAVEHTPALLERLEPLLPTTEARSLAYDSPRRYDIDLDVKVTRPYTDLAYW